MVLHACAETGSTFWSWNASGWVAVAGADQAAFFRQYPHWADGGERSYLVALAYILSGFTAFELLGKFNRLALARRVFGAPRIDGAVSRITTVLRGWGYRSARTDDALPGILCQALLTNRSPRLSDLSLPVLAQLRCDPAVPPAHRSKLFGVHRALAELRLVEPPTVHWCGTPLSPEGVATKWQESVDRWHATSVLTPTVRRSARGILFQGGPLALRPVPARRGTSAVDPRIVRRFRRRRRPFPHRRFQPAASADGETPGRAAFGVNQRIIRSGNTPVLP